MGSYLVEWFGNQTGLWRETCPKKYFRSRIKFAFAFNAGPQSAHMPGPESEGHRAVFVALFRKRAGLSDSREWLFPLGRLPRQKFDAKMPA